MNMLQIFKLGDQIGGYCNGFFGRDDYDNKICVMVNPKFAVFQNEEGEGSILAYSEGLKDCVKGDDWKYGGYDVL